MMQKLSYRTRAVLVGILIIVAYSMLVYDITSNVFFGVITDLLSGLSVVFIALFMFPLFRKTGYQKLNYLYLLSRSVEGLLMIIGGLLILSPETVASRSFIYQYIHVYFFIAGAAFFYFLCYFSLVIPRFISLWGIVATGLLLASNLIQLLRMENQVTGLFVVPMILNELFLAFWLIIKGFSKKIEQ